MKQAETWSMHVRGELECVQRQVAMGRQAVEWRFSNSLPCFLLYHSDEKSQQTHEGRNT
jgi:hypothetical protein